MYGALNITKEVVNNASIGLSAPFSGTWACTFGGDDLATLYITTTRENVPEGEQPDAGSVFATRPGVRGLPVAPYAG